MPVEHVAPAAVTHLRRERRRIADVGEQERREDAIGVGERPRAREELLDLADEFIDPLREGEVIGAGQDHAAGALDRSRSFA